MKRFRNWFADLNIYVQLSPFLFIYTLIVLIVAKNVYVGDESRYASFAQNLLHGYYSSPYPDFNLWNGPGYPIFIALFYYLKLPLTSIKLVNAFLLYLSLVVSFKTFNIYSTKKNSLLFTILLGCYFPIFDDISYILTETISWFLLSLIFFLCINVYEQKTISWKSILLAGLALAYLAMTKIIFGYVITIMILASAFFLLFPLFRNAAKKSILIFSVALILCVPWLGYTYHITNKVFYWGNSGSMSLYTMSSPFSNELGDWVEEGALHKSVNHAAFIDSIINLKALEKDNAYKIAAIENIKRHPAKYVSNWSANVGRLLFSYPFSNTQESMKTYFTFLPDMFIVVLLILTLPAAIKKYKYLPQGMIFLFLFILIYLFGSSLVSAYRRMFYITMPFWFFYFSYIFDKIIVIKINNQVDKF